MRDMIKKVRELRKIGVQNVAGPFFLFNTTEINWVILNIIRIKIV